jgi:peptidoglycan/LPS O-acetylase OafA/YrhL/lysophospholipase L1-like esterase
MTSLAKPSLARTNTSPSRTPPRYPAIDGLRGLAILSVVAYHSGLYENGIFGVDVFFTLSGFLITLTLVRRTGPRPAPALRVFYAHRAKRILPALYLTLAGVAALVFTVGSMSDVVRASQQGVASLFYVANWEQVLRANTYWNGLGLASPLSQMWSLSITEQFYLVWPPVLILTLGAQGRRSARRTLGLALALAGAMTVASTVWTLVLFDGANFDRIYLGTDTHASGLLLGCVAALLFVLVSERQVRTTLNRTPGAVRHSAVVAGPVAVAVLVTMSVLTPGYQEPWLYPWGLLAAAGLTCVITVCSTIDGPLTRLLAWRPLGTVGRASYTIFLIHMPTLWAAKQMNPEWNGFDVLIWGGLLSIVVALIIHHLFAEPFRLRRWGAFLISLALITQAGLLAWFAALPAATAHARLTGTIRVLTLGDSLANDFATALSQHGQGSLGIVDGGLGGCGIMSPEATQTADMPNLDVPTGCLPWQERWREQIAAAEPDIIVIDLGWDAVQQKIDGTWTDLSNPSLQNRYRDRLDQMASVTQRAAVPVLIASSRAESVTTSPGAVRAQNQLIESYVHNHPDAHLLDLNGLLCSESSCDTETPAGDPLYIDGVHFSAAGLSYIAPWLEDNILSSIADAR